MPRSLHALVLSIAICIAIAAAAVAPTARAQISEVKPCRSDDYLLQNGGIAPRNAMRLRESLTGLRANAKELVQRRCL